MQDGAHAPSPDNARHSFSRKGYAIAASAHCGWYHPGGSTGRACCFQALCGLPGAPAWPGSRYPPCSRCHQACLSGSLACTPPHPLSPNIISCPARLSSNSTDASPACPRGRLGCQGRDLNAGTTIPGWVPFGESLYRAQPRFPLSEMRWVPCHGTGLELPGVVPSMRRACGCGFRAPVGFSSARSVLPARGKEEVVGASAWPSTVRQRAIIMLRTQLRLAPRKWPEHPGSPLSQLGVPVFTR